MRNIVRQVCSYDNDAYNYRFKDGDIFLRLVRLDDGLELRSPIGSTVSVFRCKDFNEADNKAKEILEEFFYDKVNIEEC